MITLQQEPHTTSSGDSEYYAIGFYVAIAGTSDRRQLVMVKKDLVAKAKFEPKPEVSCEVTLPPNTTFVVIPCTFSPKSEGPFTISFTAEGMINLSPLPPSKEWKYIGCSGEWDWCSAGGCRNHSTCTRNPQFLLRVRRSGDFTILLSQPKEDFETIGFYVLKVKEADECVRELPSADIVTKADFGRSSEAVATATLDKKMHYIIVPCTFDPGYTGEFKLEIFGDSDIRLKPLKPSTQEVFLQGEWAGQSAGGCINTPLWRNNPQFFLFMQQTGKVNISLGQGDNDDSIGFYVVKTNGHRVIVIDSKEDILGKGAFEKKRDVNCELTLEQSKDPYCIIPCTFKPNIEKKFWISVNLEGGEKPKNVLNLLPCNYVWAKKSIRHEWKDGQSGGCRNNEATWLQNPICKLDAEESGDIIVILSQPHCKEPEGNSIGFYIVKTKSEGPLTNANVSMVGKGAFRRDYEVSAKLSLTKGIYYIIPCTFKAGGKGGFTLTIYSSVPSFELQAENFVPLHGGDQLTDPTSSSSSSSSPSSSRSSSSSSSSSSSGNWEFGNINWEDVKVGKKIGQGGFGAVYLGEWAGRKVAIKKLFRDEADESELATFRKEIEIMSKFSHPKIVQFLGASLQQPNICILTEFMERGNLSACLKANPDITWVRKLSMALDAAEGMVYLHSQIPAVVHRDLKSLNLLVAEDFSVKVADFGLSKATSGNSLNSKVGSLNWCAPEILLHSAPYTTASDVYSFGMVLWEIVTLESPFANMHPLQIVRSIDKGELPTVPASCEPRFAKLIQTCWSKEPSARVSFEAISKILRHLVDVENGVATAE